MENSSVTRYQRFFVAYQQVKQDASSASRSKIAQFLGQIMPFVHRQQEVRVQTAARFNLFEALGIARKEQFHSRFLAFLLEPTESHDQRALFLRTFLANILLIDTLPECLSGAAVRTEIGIETYGRVDIKMTLPDRRIIVIENKVGASEGADQIARYQDWLQGQPQPTHGQHILVFLTPEGRLPQTGNPENVRCVSYRQLGNWVSTLLPGLPERLRIVLTQYVEQCRVIGRDRRDSMTDDLHTFLMEPSNLEIMLEVEERAEAIRQEVFTRFWEWVKEELRIKLEHHSYHRQWAAYSDDIFAAGAGLGIYWKRRIDRLNRHWQFAVVVRCPADTSDWAYYGIHRGKPILPPSRHEKDQKLSDQLKAEGFEDDSPDWAGWQYLSDLRLPEFVVTQKEDVLRLNQDNHAPNHPLANELVSLLWALFDKHREALEGLNDKYPY